MNNSEQWRNVSVRDPLLGPNRARSINASDARKASAPQQISVASGVASVLNLYVGIGILSMPYAIKEAGTVGVVLPILLSFLAAFPAIQLCIGFEVCGVDSFARWSSALVGPWGWWLVTLVVVISYFGTLIVINDYIFRLCALLMPRVSLSYYGWGGVCTLAIIPFFALDYCWRGCQRLYGWTGSFLMLFVVVGFVFFSARMIEDGATGDTEVVTTLSDTIKGITAITYCYGGAACLPSVHRQLGCDVTKTSRVIYISFLLMGSATTVVGIVGYFAIGDALEPDMVEGILSRYPNSPGAQVLGAAMCLKIALQTAPLSYVLAEYAALPCLERWYGAEETLRRMGVVCAAALYLLSVPISFATKDVLDSYFDYIGAFTIVPESFTIPSCLFFLLVLRQGSEYFRAAVGPALKAEGSYVLSDDRFTMISCGVLAAIMVLLLVLAVYASIV